MISIACHCSLLKRPVHNRLPVQPYNQHNVQNICVEKNYTCTRAAVIVLKMFEYALPYLGAFMLPYRFGMKLVVIQVLKDVLS